MANKKPAYKFPKGNKAASVQKGKKKTRTIVKEALGLTNIEDLKGDVLKVWQELIKSKDKKVKAMAAKEISKYVFAQKKEITAEINGGYLQKVVVVDITDVDSGDEKD